MGFRRFRDRDGNEWEVRVRSRDEWEFLPVGDQRGEPRVARAPGYEQDPFELSQEELQRVWDASAPPRRRQVKNPFE
jgi:hypothetical protein